MIDEDLLQQFIEHRKDDKKKPMSERAVKMLVNKLHRYALQGHCPNLLLERSIINNWQDVYPSDETLLKKKKEDMGFIERHTDTSWAKELN